MIKQILFISSACSALSLHGAPSSHPAIYDLEILARNGSSRDTALIRLFAENQYVILDFYATWCGPCQKMTSVLPDIVKAYNGLVIIVKVNIDLFPDLARKYHVLSVPTLLFIKNGQEIKSTRVIGGLNKNTLIVKVQKIFNLE